MGKIAIALFGIALCDGAARAQSVAETLVTLTNKVTSLEARAPATGAGTGSALVQAVSDANGGQLHVLDSQKGTSVGLRTDNMGGNIDLTAHSGERSVYIGTEEDGSGKIGLYTARSKDPSIVLGSGESSVGYFFIYDPTGKKRLIDLNASGLFILDNTGAKSVTEFSRTHDGTGGQVFVNGAKVHDYAEVFDLAECSGLTPGSVVAASSDGMGIQLSGSAYDPAVVGVISGAGAFQPGMRIGSREDGSSNLPVAVSGQVYVRVSDEAGAIAVGDLLVSSSVAGVAMRGADKTRLTGSVVGKALQPYAGQGESLIRMLVMVR
jgi:hypothetical protein